MGMCWIGMLFVEGYLSDFCPWFTPGEGFCLLGWFYGNGRCEEAICLCKEWGLIAERQGSFNNLRVCSRNGHRMLAF